MRAVPPETIDRELRRSALERLRRNAKLRAAQSDTRSPDELLTDALKHLEEYDKTRSTGVPLEWSDSMRQLALRGGCHLICGQELVLKRSPVGGRAGNDNREPNQIIEVLAKTPAGLTLLAQAIHNGRRGLAVRVLADDQQATAIDVEPTENDKLDDVKLRTWLAGWPTEEVRPKPVDAAGMVNEDKKLLNSLTNQLCDVVHTIGGHADRQMGQDDKAVTGTPYVEGNGLRDEGNAARLKEAVEKLDRWNMLYGLLHNTGMTGNVPTPEGL